MKILHVVPTYEPAYRFGGPIRSVAGLCRALARRGHEVQVYTTSSDGPKDLDVPTGRPVDVGGVLVTYFKCRFPRRVYYAPELRQRIERDGRAWDVVHNHSVFLWPPLIASRIARRRGIPYVLSPRGMLSRSLVKRKSRIAKTLWIRLFDEANIKGAAAVHVTSDNEAAQLAEFAWRLRRVRTIPNGIDPFKLPDVDVLERFRADKGLRRPYVLYLGRIHWVKGLERLVEAMALVPHADLVLAGNDDEGYGERLRALIRARGMEERVRWLGQVVGEQKDRVLAASSVLALLSDSENFGNVVLEAMAAGRPVVVSPGVGLAAEVRRSESGLVCGGTPGEIADTLRRLVEDAPLAARLGENGRTTAERDYGWASIADRMTELYREVMEEGCRR